MKYKSPLVREVYCEFFFDVNISVTMQNMMMNLFVSPEDEIEIEPDLSRAINNKVMPVRMRLWKNGKKELVQLFENRFAYNYIPHKHSDDEEYLGWEYFLGEAEKYYNELAKIPDIKVDKLSLSYINEKIDIMDNDFIMSKYFVCDGNYIPKYVENSVVSTDVIIGMGDYSKDENTQIKIGVNKMNDTTIALKTQITITTAPNKGKNTIASLDDLHTECREMFNAIFTKHVKDEVMGGKV